MMPISASDMAERPHIDAPAWPLSHDALLEGLSEIEALFKLDDGAYEEGAPPHFRTGVELPQGDPDFAVRWAKWTRFRRGNIWRILKDQLANHPFAEIWTDATVSDFSIDHWSRRLASVRCRDDAGRILDVRADHFVLAAGTIESTRLLLMLDRCGDDRVFASCDALGRYFQDHLDAHVGRLTVRDPDRFDRLLAPRYRRLQRRSPHIELTETAQVRDGVASAFVHMTADLSQNATLGAVKRLTKRIEANDYQGLLGEFQRSRLAPGSLGRLLARRLYHHTLFMPGDVGFNLRVCIEQAPRGESRILLADTKDRLGMPKVGLKWQPGDIDERTFRSAVARLSAYWHRHGLDRICTIEWLACTLPGASITEAAQDYAHPSGTARMGTDARHSVVDADLNCHHVANLSIVSAACFPSSGSANPSLTIMLLAWRAARAVSRLMGRRAGGAQADPSLKLREAANA
ncbi:GMC oxidoreductase (plasmid) [Aliirhizobium terrae]|uniref:GMC family oxidoreductase n=1 Tax=Terrirhizobium terrae TaxID=2926709 RepID=UPI0025758C12|nr:GMC family oxidoreductase [Rhizobium sp. CC-CFT758]WJH38080.1 GMC oxidoreductase [Rhizobium sp. CC-CFT758]